VELSGRLTKKRWSRLESKVGAFGENSVATKVFEKGHQSTQHYRKQGNDKASQAAHPEFLPAHTTWDVPATASNMNNHTTFVERIM